MQYEFLERGNKKMKYEIELDGLPEGWDIKELKFTTGGIESITPGYPEYESSITAAKLRCHLIVEKIKPRRIVLEETEEFLHPAYAQESIRIDQDTKIAVESKFVWRLVKEEETK